MMKHLKLLLYLLALGLTLTACGGDEDEEIIEVETNSNRNDISKYPEAGRLEMPRLKGGNSILIVHKTSDSYDAQGVNYCVEWDVQKKSQRWSSYQLNYSLLKQGTKRYESDDNQYPFDEDMQANYYFDYDYFWGSGFDHGHICPSADRLYSREANYQTFYLTNMQPQYKAFNGSFQGSESYKNEYSPWYRLEVKVRQLARATATEMLYVVKGGTIEDNQILPNKVKGMMRVPKYFFVALLMKNENGYRAIGFWMEHKENYAQKLPLTEYAVNIEELQRLTGIDFFCNLPDNIEKKVEANIALDTWGLQ